MRTNKFSKLSEKIERSSLEAPRVKEIKNARLNREGGIEVVPTHQIVHSEGSEYVDFFQKTDGSYLTLKGASGETYTNKAQFFEMYNQWVLANVQSDDVDQYPKLLNNGVEVDNEFSKSFQEGLYCKAGEDTALNSVFLNLELGDYFRIQWQKSAVFASTTGKINFFSEFLQDGRIVKREYLSTTISESSVDVSLDNIYTYQDTSSSSKYTYIVMIASVGSDEYCYVVKLSNDNGFVVGSGLTHLNPLNFYSGFLGAYKAADDITIRVGGSVYYELDKQTLTIVEVNLVSQARTSDFVSFDAGFHLHYRRSLNKIFIDTYLETLDQFDVEFMNDYFGYALIFKDGSYSNMIGIDLTNKSYNAGATLYKSNVLLATLVKTKLEFIDVVGYQNDYQNVANFDNVLNRVTFNGDYSGLEIGDTLVVGTDSDSSIKTITSLVSSTIIELDSLTYSGAGYAMKEGVDNSFDYVDEIIFYGADSLASNFFLESKRPLDITSISPFFGTYVSQLTSIGNVSFLDVSNKEYTDAPSDKFRYKLLSSVNERYYASSGNAEHESLDDNKNVLFNSQINELPSSLNIKSDTILLRNIENITGMEEVNERLAVFDANNVTMLSGTSQGRLFLNKGTINYNAIASDGNRIIYLRKDGFWLLDYIGLQHISREVFEYSLFGNISEQGFKDASAGIDTTLNIYICSIPELNRIICYDMIDDQFFDIDMNISVFDLGFPYKLRQSNGSVQGLLNISKAYQTMSGTTVYNEYSIIEFFKGVENSSIIESDFVYLSIEPYSNVPSCEVKSNRIVLANKRSMLRYIEVYYTSTNDITLRLYKINDSSEALTTTITIPSSSDEFNQKRIYLKGLIGKEFRVEMDITSTFELKGFNFG